MKLGQFTLRMAKLRRAFYNAVLLAAVLAPAIGCGGKPTPPPPGAGGESPPPAIELGNESGSPQEGTGDPTPTEGNSPAADSGAK
jgi:hypothetical protein